MSSIPHSPPSTATHRKRKPDPARVYQVFLHEARSAGRRNAASRTATAFGLSDDTVRRIVAKFEKVDDTPPEVQYQPAPGQVDYEVKREQQARELASKLPQHMPQTVLTAAASVEPEPQAPPQHDAPDQRQILMSSNTDFEREMRRLGIDLNMQQPQTAVPQNRTGEREHLSHPCPATPQLASIIPDPLPPDPNPDPTAPLPDPLPEPIPPEPIPPIVERGISLRDDYVKQRTTDRAVHISVPRLDWGQLVAYAGPVLLVVFLIVAMLMSAAR